MPSSKYLAGDFEIIDQAFSQNTDEINSDIQVTNILSEMLNDVSKKIHIPINFYYAVRNRNSDWMNEFRNFKYATYLTDNFDQVFKNTIDINTINSIPGNTDRRGGWPGTRIYQARRRRRRRSVAGRNGVHAIVPHDGRHAFRFLRHGQIRL